MSVSNHINEFLKSNHVKYHVVTHKHTFSALDSAHSAHVPEKNLVKSVLLQDSISGNYSIALLPSCKKLDQGALSCRTEPVEIADEEAIGPQFPDCESGVVPGFGHPYHMDMIWDTALEEADTLYFESGDHESLVEIDHEEFMRLFSGFPHRKISTP